ncbi:hypothetical protein [Aerophototrophica crusticola]|uniref:hypothetical protein n=1 Tax=Aerophototrophica crusticola TaxID=1709002 RepID=UPI003850BC1F
MADRGVLALSGPERVAFLQGLVSNDVAKPDRAVWAALLTPQGKYLHDFFVVPDGERLLLECEAGRRDDLYRRLRMYKLRSKVELADVTDQFASFAVIGDGATEAVGLAGEPGTVAAFAGAWPMRTRGWPGWAHACCCPPALRPIWPRGASPIGTGCA